jgi:hypothetical protein
MPPDCVQPAPWSLEVFRSRAATVRRPTRTLAELRLLQSLTSGRHRARCARARAVPPAGFVPLQRSQNEEATTRMQARGCAGPSTARLRSVSRVSHPPDGLLLLEPCRLVPSGSRSWGFALQSLAPARQPLRLPTLVAVMAFTAPRDINIIALAPWHAGNSGDEAGTRPDFTALLRQRSPSLRHARLSARRARSSPGLSPSPGIRPPHLGSRFRVPPPAGLPAGPFRATEATRLGPEGAPRSVDRCDGRPVSLEAGCPS